MIPEFTAAKIENKSGDPLPNANIVIPMRSIVCKMHRTIARVVVSGAERVIDGSMNA